MAEFQVTTEFAVELNNFYNIDLFHRGCYQIRVLLKSPPKSPDKIETSLCKSTSRPNLNGPGGSGYHAVIVDNALFSRKFQIFYRNEDISIDGAALFRLHTLVNSGEVVRRLQSITAHLVVELWYSPRESVEKMELESQRSLTLRLDHTKGLHCHLPVIFDYCHLAAVEVTVHGMLVAIHQPYIGMTSSPFITTSKRLVAPHQSALGVAYFGQRPSMSPTSDEAYSCRVRRARSTHGALCDMLLDAHDSLLWTLTFYQDHVLTTDGPGVTIDCQPHSHDRLLEIVTRIQSIDDEEEMMQRAITDLIQLCAENAILWAKFVDVTMLRPELKRYLAKLYHTKKVRRLAEAFFTKENTKSSCLCVHDPSVHGHASLATRVRNSDYFHQLLPLPIECVELDGDSSTLPIIFEDIYFDDLPVPIQANGCHRCHGDVEVDDIGEVGSTRLLNSGDDDGMSYKVRDSRRKIVKYLKPDIIGHASSYSCEVAEVTSACRKPLAGDSQCVSLTGYSKNAGTPTLPPVLLGTLSLTGNMSAGVERLPTSLPSPASTTTDTTSPTFVRSCWSRSSVPSLKEFDRRSGVAGIDLRRSMFHSGYEQLTRICRPHNFPGGDELLPERNSNGVGDHFGVLSQLDDAVIPVRTSCQSQCQGDIQCPSVDAMRCGVHPCDSTWLDFGHDIRDVEIVVGDSERVGGDADSDPVVEVGGDDERCGNQLTDGVSYAGSALSVILGGGSDLSLNDSVQGGSGSLSADMDVGGNQPTSSVLVDGDLCSLSVNSVKRFVQPSMCDNGNDGCNDATCSILNQGNIPNYDTDDGDDVAGLGGGECEAAVCITSLAAECHMTCSSENGDCDSSRDLSRDLSCDMSFDLKKSCSCGSGSEFSATIIHSPSPPSPLSYHDSLTDRADQLSVMSDKRSPACHDLDPVNTHMITMNEFLLEESSLCRCGSSPGQMSTGPSYQCHRANPSDLSTRPSEQCHRAFSDGNLVKDVDLIGQRHPRSCASEGSLRNTRWSPSSSSHPGLTSLFSRQDGSISGVVSTVTDDAVRFVNLRENFIQSLSYSGHLYSESSCLASRIPYLMSPDECDDSGGLHLVVCVHGFDGRGSDLRLVRMYLEMALPSYRLEFLMSERNQDTLSDLLTMSEKLVQEILSYVEGVYDGLVARLSFVGHSLGNVVIRSALTSPKLVHLLPILHTFLSLSGPHLGTLYNNSGLINVGLWLMLKLRKSSALMQLSLKDHDDPRRTFLYKLSQKPVLQYFRHVLLVSSVQDRYVPYHSSRIEPCQAARRDTSVFGRVYTEMVDNILTPIIQTQTCKLIRYDVFHAVSSFTTSNVIGKAAHIAVLDSELFLEKFLLVAGLHYFK